MDKPKVTPKDFFLWAMAMIAIYSSVFALITLLFSYIDYTFPDALNYFVGPYGSGMRIGIAPLVVMFPLFLVMMRFIRSDILRDATRRDVWIRRWALYLTVFFAGLTIIIDLIALINAFLGGEITTRFILKVFVVLAVAGVAFMYFLAATTGFWLKYPERARYVGWGVGALVLCTIAAGFLIMGSPNQIRMYKFDDQKISDLTNIQYQIINYWQRKQALPETLEQLNDPLSGAVVPMDPQNGAAYQYKIDGPLKFELCAEFNALTQPNSQYGRMTMPIPPTAANYEGKDAASYTNNTWTHEAGHQCFTRTIDPELYPPYDQKKPV